MLRDATVASSSILEAGFELFRHYGFKKTTMGEIAKRAGVSRPTLYARYESKEHIFAAVVEHYVGELAREVEERAADVATLHDKLAIAFEVGMVRPHEASRADSFKRELLELDDPRVNEALDSAHQTYDRLLTKLIKQSGVDLKPLGITAPKLGHLLNTAARGFKENARDTKELRQMLKGLVSLVRAATAGESR